MLTPIEAGLLAFLRAKFGNQTKRLIRRAWETGDYSALGVNSNAETTLQDLRNTKGPGWLADLKWPSVEGSKP